MVEASEHSCVFYQTDDMAGAIQRGGRVGPLLPAERGQLCSLWFSSVRSAQGSGC